MKAAAARPAPPVAIAPRTFAILHHPLALAHLLGALRHAQAHTVILHGSLTHTGTHTRKRTRLSHTARRKPTLNVAGSYPLFRCLLCVCLLSKRAAKCFHAVKKLACCCLRPCPKVATGPRSTSGQQWAVPSCVQNHQTKPQCSQLAFSKPRP